jgi:hypothetical protein
MSNTFTKELVGGGRMVGEIMQFPIRKAISASFPYLNLASANAILNIANYPYYVPFLRDEVKAEYDPFGSPVSAFTVTSWSISGSTVTLNFASNTANDVMLACLHEEAFVHTSNTILAGYSAEISGLTGFRTVTLGSNFAGTNPVPAGTYAITSVHRGSRLIKIDVSGVSPTPSGPSAAGTVEFYLHRIAGSTTTVRHFQQVGRGFMTPGDADGYFIAGLRTRGYFQGHLHGLDQYTDTGGSNIVLLTSITANGNINNVDIFQKTKASVTDGTNGTPLTRKITHGPASIIHAYHYVGEYRP